MIFETGPFHTEMDRKLEHVQSYAVHNDGKKTEGNIEKVSYDEGKQPYKKEGRFSEHRPQHAVYRLTDGQTGQTYRP
jgi:hypothetical protein